MTRRVLSFEFDYYPVEDGVSYYLRIPRGEEYLAYSNDRLWVSVDPSQPTRLLHFRIVMGDGKIAEGYRYVGTWGERHLFVRNELQPTQ
jgi:hypothetical protein